MNPGDVLTVVLKKQIELSDTEKFWVAETAEGERFLMDSIQYENYGLTVGQLINVTVDKINCSGKVFIEPDHPVYKRGDSFLFKVDSIIARSESEYSLLVADVFGNKIPIQYHIENNSKIPAEVQLLVIGLRKAMPVLLDPVLKGKTPFVENEIFSFNVLDKVLVDQESYFQLEDEFRRIHLLPAKYYEKYPITIGKPLDCYIVRIGQNAELTLEPVHPVFHIGYELELTFDGLYAGQEYIGKKHKLYLLHDNEGNDFFMSVRFMEGRTIPSAMRCRIEKLKKGQPLVEPVW